MKLKLVALAFLIIPALAFAQDAAKKKAYYFYGEQCSHCKTVDAHFQANGIYDKYEITKLEVTSNPFNGKKFLEFGKALGVPDWGGVPAIVFGNKYLLGDKPIIDNFEKEIDASNDANELPDPEKIEGAKAAENQRPFPVEAMAGAGNKKNYLSVIIGALIVLGIGVLVFVNRKKS